MTDHLAITSYASIRPGRAMLNGQVFYEGLHESGFNGFSRYLYKKLDLLYPRFFKMDDLCKLAFLASEMNWMQNDILNRTSGSQMSVVLSNRSSSLETDRIFYSSIGNEDDYFPSPAIFVYTLPNIAIGEVCIKNKITGENAFFIFDQFNAGELFDYVAELLNQNRAEACLCGWCDFDNGLEDALLMIVEKSGNAKSLAQFSAENLNKIYTQIG